jgi:hypothetical protein
VRNYSKSAVAKRVVPLVAVLAVAAGIAVKTIGPEHAAIADTTPIRAIFYYPWFPGAWNQQGLNPFTKYKPTLGYYDGGSVAVIDQQLAWIKQAKQNALIASWFSGNTLQTTNIGKVLAELPKYQPLKLAIYYEIGNAIPTETKMSSDFSTILSKWAGNANFLKVDGKPVVFVYQPSSAGCGGVASIVKAAAGRVYLSPKVFTGFKTCALQPSSWHQYGPASATSSQLPYSYTISPGFYKANESAPRLVRNLTRFETNVASMVASKAKWQLTATFNEWGEGTAVEPATAWNTDYIKVLAGEIPTTPPSTTTTPNTVPTTSTVATTTATTPSTTTTPGTTTTPTTTSNSGDPVIVAAGDIACDPSTTSQPPSNCNQGGTAAVINSVKPQAVLTLGDNQYEKNTLTAYQSVFDKSWGTFKSIIKPAIGNHEYLTTGATGYCSYFGAVASCGGSTATKAYYSYNVGSWHLISLNSECSFISQCAAEKTWLHNDLATHTNTCTLAYWHEPAWSSGQHGNAPQMLTMWNDLVAAKADIVLSGHNHDYERFEPIGSASSNADGTSPPAKADGIREWIVGTGGKNHYALAPAALNNEVVRNSVTYGVLKLTLHPASYDWKFLPVAGSTFTDSGTGACH